MDIPNKETIVWRVPEWIQAYGGLTTENVLEYFATSPFYDRQSNNQVLKMQSQFNMLGDLNQRLSSMRGIDDAQVLKKATTLSSSRDPPGSNSAVTPLTYYFVVNENIYQSSDVYSIIASRMLSASHALRSAISAVQTLTQQQKESPSQPSQSGIVQGQEGEMIQALQSTLRVLQSERMRLSAEANRVGGQTKKGDRESASPVDLKSPKSRRRKSKAG